ncbi:sigma-70 family RNA polymerase sigma factor [Dehalobacter sp. DCM]|uniref:RNA polymerase sigma factor n=1 Tax=Dehalobacter sp. DCM TaxID=2907827 RepID=UPI0030812161|nr:sigma-70 family RNA polymerase sigma factor [Dehalobacter sp. DCM]
MKINDNNQPITARFIEIDGEQIPVTEEVYRAFKQPAWAEHKRKQRERRCRDSKGRVCTQSCRLCDLNRMLDDKEPIKKNSLLLSLDWFQDDGFDQEDPADIEEIIAEKELLTELLSALEELDPDNRRIMELFASGKSERDIAADIGLSQKAVNKRKTKLFAQLKDRLKDFI